MKWHLLALLFAMAPGPALAGDASLYTLNLTGEGMRFTASMNGIPVGPPGNPAESLAYSVDAFMHQGTNRLSVVMDRIGPKGAAGVALLGPGTGAFGLGEAPRLAAFACNPVAGGGVPACKVHEIFAAEMMRAQAPELRLWHASPLPAGTSPDAAIAAALLSLTGELAKAARAQNWSRLFYLTDIRQADLLRANPAIGQDEAAMAAVMQAAQGGEVKVAASPESADLAVSALPGSLWSVQRTDGTPLLRITVGRAPAKAAPDPERFGDLSERWVGGVVQLRVAVFGIFDGRWQLVR